ncbi:acetyl esterase, partial [Salmonella enterica]
GGLDSRGVLSRSRFLSQPYRAKQRPGKYKMYPGTLHASLHYSGMIKTADEALQDGAHFFKQQF